MSTLYAGLDRCCTILFLWVNRLTPLTQRITNFSGEFPASLSNLRSLTYFDVSFCNFRGLIPSSSLANLTRKLTYLSLESNYFHGQIPSFPSLLLTTLELDENLFTGEIPSSIGNLTRLTKLGLRNNQLTGRIPSFLTNLDHLESLFISCLIDLVTSNHGLSILSLSNNNLDGTIPDLLDIGNRSCKLKMMDVSDNRLQGPLPRSLLSSCNELEFLNVGNNSIYDSFPAWLGSLANLRVLILRSNRFHGTIEEVEDNDDRDWFPNLQVIDISHNSFSGFLPSKYFRSWKGMRVLSDHEDGAKYIGESVFPNIFAFQTPDVLEYDYSMTINNKGFEMVYAKILNYFIAIDLSSNNFTGEIPESVGSLARLRLLNLSNNLLTGHIPVFLKDLTHLEALDLSRNDLSGDIPRQLTQLSYLSFLNVSYRLSGIVPRGKQFNTFQNDSYIGNLGLCGEPLSEDCGGRTIPPYEEAEGSYFELDWPIVLMGAVSGLVVGAVMGLVVPIRRNNWFVWKISEFVRARLAR